MANCTAGMAVRTVGTAFYVWVLSKIRDLAISDNDFVKKMVELDLIASRFLFCRERLEWFNIQVVLKIS